MVSASPLELMIITNNQDEAKIWDDAGVDFIFIDLEKIGKKERQRDMDTVISEHCASDISEVKRVLRKSKVLVRLNPLHAGIREEIDEVIERGADTLMLPMFENTDEVETLVEMVGGRASVYPLIETRAALENAKALAKVKNVEGYHFGLNDLHLQFDLDFMFQVLLLDEFEQAAAIFQAKGVKFGIGGVSALGHGDLPAELILHEHFRLGSNRAILSRRFKFVTESSLRPTGDYVRELKEYYAASRHAQLLQSHQLLVEKIEEIAQRRVSH